MTFMVVDTNSYDVFTWLGFFDKDWCNRGCGTKPNPSKAWSRRQCGGLAIDYGKFITKNELRNSDAGCYYNLEKHTYQ